MKSSSNKLNKVKDLPKGDNTANKEFANMEQGTPEIFARSRLSSDEISSRTEEEKDMQLKEMNNLLFEQRRELEQAQEALKESQQQHKETSQAYTEISQKLSNSIPLTPGPNINKPRIPRPQDVAYKAVIENQTNEKEEVEEQNESEQGNIMKIFSQLTNVLKETNKSDINTPPKFYGDDEKWEGWYKQWRAYLQAKEWLTTAEHPQGPGATDFNLKINSRIYNSLVNLCQKGKAITYIEQAAEFDGHGANQQLLIRY